MPGDDKATRRARLNALKDLSRTRALTGDEQLEVTALKKAELLEKKARLTSQLRQLDKPPRDDQALTEKQKILIGVAFAASCRQKDGTDWRRSGMAWRSMVEVLHQQLTRSSDRGAFPELRDRPPPQKPSATPKTQP